MDFDNRGVGTMKQIKKDFYVAMPTNESSLRNRLEVLGACYEMLKLRFMANPIIATASLDILKQYADFLCGESVWGMVVHGAEGPISCPSVRQVCNYDQAVRDLQIKLMKSGKDFKSALDLAIADPDTRMLYFTTPFGIEANTPECKALTAPALQEIYTRLPGMGRGLKRPLGLTDAPPPPTTHETARPVSASAKKKAKQKAKKAAEAAAAAAAGGAHKKPKPILALKDAPRGSANSAGDNGKGKGKGNSRVPKGIKSKQNGRTVCFCFNRGEDCTKNPCDFLHVCWWCHGAHQGGMSKTC